MNILVRYQENPAGGAGNGLGVTPEGEVYHIDFLEDTPSNLLDLEIPIVGPEEEIGIYYARLGNRKK